MENKLIYYPENETINTLIDFCCNKTGALKKTTDNDISYCGIAAGEPINHECPFKGKLAVISFYKNERLQKENRYTCNKKEDKQ